MWSPIKNLASLADLPFWQGITYTDIVHKPPKKVKTKAIPKIEDLKNLVTYGLYHFREHKDMFVHNFVLCTTDELRQYHEAFNMGQFFDFPLGSHVDIALQCQLTFLALIKNSKKTII